MVRVVSGVLLAGAFFAIVWFSSATVLLVTALGVGVLAFHEYAEIARVIGMPVPRTASLGATLATIAVVPFPYVAVEAVIGAGMVIIAIAVMSQPLLAEAVRLPSDVARPRIDALPPAPSGRRTFSPSLNGVLAGAFAMIYLGIPLGALVAIHVYGGRGAVVLLVATVALSDTAQYYTGRAFGHRPLAPHLSPKKTVEGAIGGFVAAPLFLFFAGPYFIPPATPAVIAPLGLVLAACGIAGDLFESMLKRAADMKDSSALIPGHGGVLDRIDALLFATPPFLLFLRWVYTT